MYCGIRVRIRKCVLKTMAEWIVKVPDAELESSTAKDMIELEFEHVKQEALKQYG